MNVQFRRITLVVAVMALLAVVAITAPEPVSAQSTGASSGFQGGIVDPEAWADTVTCAEPGCVTDVEIKTIQACGVPIFQVAGSFIVTKRSWGKHEGLIRDRIIVEQARVLSDNYMLLEVDPDTTFASMRWLQRRGVEISMNTLSFYSQLWGWYPNAAPEIADESTPRFEPPNLNPTGEAPIATAVTIDTGIVPNTTNDALSHGVVGSPDENVDTAQLNSVTGHGPSIADLIGRITGANIGAERTTLLSEVYYEKSPGGYPLIGGFAEADFLSAMTLDTASLLATLERLPARTKVVNLSLGLKACPNHAMVWERDLSTGQVTRRLTDPIRQWIMRNPDVTVVAAAGNSASRARTYPAAWAMDPAINNVIAVGSMGEDGTRSCFSDYGNWVEWYAVGERVLTQHPTMGLVVSSGTSYASPQVAAAISVGASLEEVAKHRSQVPAPSRENLRLCD